MNLIISTSPKLNHNHYPAGLNLHWNQKKHGRDTPRELFFLVDGNIWGCEGGGWKSFNLPEFVKQCKRKGLHVFQYTKGRWVLEVDDE